MIVIRQKRVRNIASYLTESFNNQEIIIGVRVDQVTEAAIARAGLTSPLTVGDSILPNAVGPVSRFNSRGKEVPQRDQPKETLYRDMEFTRTEWHGRDRVEVTDCVWIPYQRYPRELINAPEVRLNVVNAPDGTLMIVSGPYLCSEQSYSDLKHVVNLYLELFGVCDLLLKGEDPIVFPKVKLLNWNILPPGVHPWDRIRDNIAQSLERQPPKSLAAAMNRFERIVALGPDFTAVGNGGYRGYVVFGFSSKNRFVMECQRVNNAIYIFDKNWEEFSKYTKAEVLNQSLQVRRIIHTANWLRELTAALT